MVVGVPCVCGLSGCCVFVVVGVLHVSCCRSLCVCGVGCRVFVVYQGAVYLWL